MAGLKGDNPVEQLREKLARDARWRVRERYFALRIVPVLLGWALLMAAAKVAAGGLISLGAALTTYFSGAVLLLDNAHRLRPCGIAAQRYPSERGGEAQTATDPPRPPKWIKSNARPCNAGHDALAR